MRMPPATRRALTAAALLSCVACGCRESKKTPQAPPPRGDPAESPGEARPPAERDASGPGRSPMVPGDHPLHARVEGTSFDNACESDGDCHVGGCSKEVCSAAEGVHTTCEVRDWPTGGGSCGCVDGACVWFAPAGGDEADGGAPAAALPGQGEECAEGGRCRAGLTCLEYYGVAGPRGPKFTSCEIRCGEKAACPRGQKCVTIADGPGRVCRAAEDR